MYEDTTLHINRMKENEDFAMQTGNLIEKTTTNCRFMTWLWHHHWRNHYSYGVISVTRSCTNLYLYYFIIKCNLFIKILQRGKNTKNMRLVHCWTSSAAEPWRFLRTCQIDMNWKPQKQPAPVYTFWNFLKFEWGKGRGEF